MNEGTTLEDDTTIIRAEALAEPCAVMVVDDDVVDEDVDVDLTLVVEADEIVDEDLMVEVEADEVEVVEPPVMVAWA